MAFNLVNPYCFEARQGSQVEDHCPSTVFDRDSAIRVRNGVTVYVDVFRPSEQTEKYPAILFWSPYGKTSPGAQQYETIGPF